MVGESWRMAAKLCDSCKSATATLYCRADSAFLCVGCDSKIHAANKLASRHARVWMCEVCEQAPASVTCKADAAALCVTCDRDIHSANPLARRHERSPVVPFYEPSASAVKSSGSSGDYFSDLEGEAEEAEAASWLLPNPNPNGKVMEGGPDLKPNEYNMLLSDDQMYPYLDLDMISRDQKAQYQYQHRHRHPHQHEQQHSSGTDGVVPTQKRNLVQQQHTTPSLVDGIPCYDVDYTTGSKPFVYSFNSPPLSQSVSSSSLDVGVVPEHNAMADDVSNNFVRSNNAEIAPNQISGIDREARVLRYREKRKNRKFEKTIRYASRKAYAETRPRIKGRFAKRSEEAIYSSPVMVTTDADYVVVPSY